MPPKGRSSLKTVGFVVQPDRYSVLARTQQAFLAWWAAAGARRTFCQFSTGTQRRCCCCAELMVGGSLSDAMRMHRTFTLRRAMEVAIDTARGLAYLHAKKNGAIIHRWAVPYFVAASALDQMRSLSRLCAGIC